MTEDCSFVVAGIKAQRRGKPEETEAKGSDPRVRRSAKVPQNSGQNSEAVPSELEPTSLSPPLLNGVPVGNGERVESGTD